MGGKLLCVRYRYDKDKKELFTTLGLVVKRKYFPKHNEYWKAFPHPNRQVLVKVEYHEEEIRGKIKISGGIWLKDKRMWKLPYHKGLELGMKDRVQEIKQNS